MEKNFQNKFSFMTVRHPLERLLSAYRLLTFFLFTPWKFKFGFSGTSSLLTAIQRRKGLSSKSGIESLAKRSSASTARNCLTNLCIREPRHSVSLSDLWPIFHWTSWTGIGCQCFCNACLVIMIMTSLPALKLSMRTARRSLGGSVCRQIYPNLMLPKEILQAPPLRPNTTHRYQKIVCTRSSNFMNTTFWSSTIL